MAAVTAHIPAACLAGAEAAQQTGEMVPALCLAALELPAAAAGIQSLPHFGGAPPEAKQCAGAARALRSGGGGQREAEDFLILLGDVHGLTGFGIFFG